MELLETIVLSLLGLSVLIAAALIQNKADLARCKGENIIKKGVH